MISFELCYISRVVCMHCAPRRYLRVVREPVSNDASSVMMRVVARTVETSLRELRIEHVACTL